MASDFTRLMKQDFGDLEAAARAWTKVSEDMDGYAARHRTRVTGPLYASWKGDDADAALFYLEDVETRFGVVRTEAMTIGTVLETTRFWMEQAQTDLRNAVSRAEENGYAVDDDGVLTDAQSAALPHNDPDAQELARGRGSLRVELQDRIDQALQDARKAGADGVRALSSLDATVTDRFNDDAAAESAHDVTDAMKAVGLQGPQIPDDPKAAAEWWKVLSPEDRARYETLYPAQIGATDGLPSDVRDSANRLALEQELNDAEFGGPEDFRDISNDERNKRIQNLHVLKDRLDRGDGAPPGKELYLLNYKSAHDGQAVIAMGNPDTAAHTAVLVPGTNTTMDSVDGQLGRIGKLQNSADKWSDGQPVSTIMWLGYDAPEASGGDLNTSVLNKGRAEDGAPDLRHFVEGTRAAQGDRHGHITVIGHSYGSTTVGAAAAGGHGLGADDIVVVGSPGMTVDHASDLNMDPSHVWVGAASDDPIIDDFSDLTLGDNPAEEPFGGRNFEVDTHGHSGYWDDGSDSLDNQGRIIAGVPPAEVPKNDNDIPLFPG
ncbi:alpha/beta hydrolase [Streptacidiphilus griseoplanus]|uniref:alpha/beta hydrolase n=1 Tax=Peterkaempfera griseoplana TaxID=66896 RepID=UPI0006E1FD8D|nr:alpha/beta hydrolase [Peterkaempfera griseoplana]